MQISFPLCSTHIAPLECPPFNLINVLVIVKKRVLDTGARKAIGAGTEG